MHLFAVLCGLILCSHWKVNRRENDNKNWWKMEIWLCDSCLTEDWKSIWVKKHLKNTAIVKFWIKDYIMPFPFWIFKIRLKGRVLSKFLLFNSFTGNRNIIIIIIKELMACLTSPECNFVLCICYKVQKRFCSINVCMLYDVSHLKAIRGW